MTEDARNHPRSPTGEERSRPRETRSPRRDQFGSKDEEAEDAEAEDRR
jgi:hypothetical protein